MPLKVWEKNVREIKNDVAKHAAYNYCGLFFSFFFWIVIQRSRGWMCLSELLCVICSEFLPAPSKQEKLTRVQGKQAGRRPEAFVLLCLCDHMLEGKKNILKLQMDTSDISIKFWLCLVQQVAHSSGSFCVWAAFIIKADFNQRIKIIGRKVLHVLVTN